MANKRDRDKLRNRVKSALERSGLTQKELETQAGWSVGTLSRVFSGKKKPDTRFFQVLATELATTPAELVAGTEFASLFSDEATQEGAPERTARPAEERAASPEPAAEAGEGEEPESAVERTETAEEVTPTAEALPSVEAPAEPSPAEPSPGEPGPAEGSRARAPEPERGPRPEWKPPPERRRRKRDLPYRIAKWIAGLVFGG